MQSKKLLTRKIAIGLAAGMLFAHGQAFAEEFQLDQVTVTATRIEEPLANVPQDVTVITKEQLEQKGAKNLADALKGVPGVVVKQQGGIGEISTAFVLGSDRVVVLIDGKRMNLPQGIGTGSAGVNLSTILLSDNIEKIEVVRGGGSALYGADAVGGVINIITKKGSDQAKTTISSGFGSDSTYRHIVTNQGADGKFRWHITGLREATDGQRPNSDYSGKNISSRFDQALSPDETVTLTYDYLSSHAGFPGEVNAPKLRDFGDVLRRNWGISYTAKHDGGDRTISYYKHNNIYDGNIVDWMGSDDFFRHQNTVQAIEYQDSAKAGNGIWTWGGEWRKDEVASDKHVRPKHDATTKAGYLQHQYSWTAKTTLIGGIRYDNNSVYGTNWLPKAAILYKADEKTSLFANWGKIFKAPSFDDLYADYGYGMTGNPDLRAETGWAAELGVKKQVSNTSEATISMFKRNLNDAIDWANSPDGWKVSNVDKYTSTGINAALTTRLSEVTTANLSYTYLDSKDQDDQYMGEPRNTFHVGLTNLSGKLTSTINGSYMDKAGKGMSRVSSYFTVDTTLNYAVSKDQSLFLTVNNLFDRKYQAVKGYPAQERTVFMGIKQSF